MYGVLYRDFRSCEWHPGFSILVRLNIKILVNISVRQCWPFLGQSDAQGSGCNRSELSRRATGPELGPIPIQPLISLPHKSFSRRDCSFFFSHQLF